MVPEKQTNIAADGSNLILTDLDLDISYRSDTSDLVQDFYTACLSRSVLYRRSVGYFTSASLSIAAQGIATLLSAGGKIRLIASPCLSEDDVRAMREGYALKEEIMKEAAVRTFRDIHDRIVVGRLDALAWLIAQDLLQVKLAIRTNDTGYHSSGIYHERVGVFTDKLGNHVAFSGSANESKGGFVDNFESIDVFCSWQDQRRTGRKISEFDRMWNEEEVTGLELLDFTEATDEILRPYKSANPPTNDPIQSHHIPKPNPGIPRIPPDVEPRDYQNQAVANWFKNNGRGTLKMATGSGKTITALTIATKLYERKKSAHLIIVCPYKHLVVQWDKECRRFGLDPILAFESRHQWSEELAVRNYNTSANSSRFLAVITTNKTFSGDPFQSLLSAFPRNTLLIADEVHNLGAKELHSKLPDHIVYRVGLSATPERWFDDTGSRKLFEYFGPMLEPEFTLRDAILADALVRYRYHPIFIELTEDEHTTYLDLSRRISKMWASEKENDKSSALKSLLIRRARLLAGAHNKMGALRSAMQGHLTDTHMLFYCGDGKIEDEHGDSLRHVEAICKLLGTELKIRVATYTAETSLEMRSSHLDRLDKGDLQGLVAIRCLDEGVDVPSIRTAFILASSTNPRQFIQRRGRILRKSPGKDSADIYDMIVIPNNIDEIADSERNLVRKELLRYVEFADLALNNGQARKAILPIQERFDLLGV